MASESAPCVPVRLSVRLHGPHAVQAFDAPPPALFFVFLFPACCVQEDFQSSNPRDFLLDYVRFFFLQQDLTE